LEALAQRRVVGGRRSGHGRPVSRIQTCADPAEEECGETLRLATSTGRLPVIDRRRWEDWCTMPDNDPNDRNPFSRKPGSAGGGSGTPKPRFAPWLIVPILLV